MKEKSIIIIVITVLFIIATGILYCVNESKTQSQDMILTDQSSSEDAVTKENSIKDETTKKNESNNSKDDTNVSEVEDSKEIEICVHICGQVKKPGVYEVKESDRVADVIRQAGGLSKKAAADTVNQAQHVVDGQQIYIPSKDEVLKGTHSNGMMKEAEESALVNINTASMEELMTLPGIGESKADSIIKYREKNQGFQSIEDIKKIEGIKEGVFAKIRDFISIS